MTPAFVWTDHGHMCGDGGCTNIARDDRYGVTRNTKADMPAEYYIDGDDKWIYENEFDLMRYLKEAHPGKAPRTHRKAIEHKSACGRWLEERPVIVWE